jgi:regulator of sigma E protease
MAIISAGVFMNVLTAVVFFALAFNHGIQMPPSTIGALQVGFPAWEAGLQPGDHITSIAGRKTETFDDIQRAIAFSSGSIEVQGVHPDGKSFDVTVVPKTSKGRRMLGVSPGLGLRVVRPRDPSDAVTLPDSPAAAANPSFQPGDRIVAIDNQKVANFMELQQRLVADRDRPVELQVVRDKGESTPVSIRVAPQAFRSLGLTMDIGKISAMVKNSPAEKNGIQVLDKILRVNGKSVGTEIDPLQLPDYLASLAGEEVTIAVQREVKGADPQTIDVRLVPQKKAGWVERPDKADLPLSAPAIGVAYYVIPTILNVAPHSPADENDIKKGDRVKKAEIVLPNGKKSDPFGSKPIVVDFEQHGEPANWATVVSLMQLATDRDVVLTLSNPARTVRCTPAADASAKWFVPGERGLLLSAQSMTLKSKGVLDAASMGLMHTRNSIVDLYLTLRNLVTGQLSVENLHGPLGIATVAYDFARQGLADLSLFLGFLSVNLAVLNFLPIPVLDGGHMMFLIWEAVTRKRPSERVQVAATYFGMAFVLCLFLLVLYLDVFVHGVAG